MRRWIWAGAVVALQLPSPASARAQGRSWFDSPRTFSLYEENDVLARAPVTSDSSYTQGLRLTWEFSMWKPGWNSLFERVALVQPFRSVGLMDSMQPNRACLPRASRMRRPCGTVAFGLGQSEYTPGNLLVETLQPGDRPYAGHLFISGAWSVAYARTFVSTELLVGVTGDPSLGRHAQSLAHWTWSSGSEKPLGWDNQLQTTVHVELINSYLWHALEMCRPRDGSKACDGTYDEHRIFDISPRAELAAGSLMTRASLGAIARVGYKFPDAMNVQRIPVTASAADRARPQLWFMVFAMADGRAVGHNALLSGSPLADDGPEGWRERGRIETEHTLGEWAYGFAVGSRWVTLVWQQAQRSSEFRPTGASRRNDPHRYGSIMLALHTLGGAR